MWIESLDLRQMDKKILEKGGVLTDRLICAGQDILKRQFPHLQGLQSTLYSQELDKFTPVNDEGIILMYNHVKGKQLYPYSFIW